MKDLNNLRGKQIPSFMGVVNGKRDSGKSTFVRQYLMPKLKKIKPVIVLDISGEYRGDYEHSGFWEFYDHVETTAGIKTGVHIIEWVNMKEDPLHLFEFIRQTGKEQKRLPISLILEEGHLLFSKSLKSTIEEPLNETCFMGAHYGMDTILCTQRPYSLTVDVRSQADFFVSFLQKERRDLDYLRQKQEAPDDVDDVVANLENHQFFSIGERPKGLDEIKINEINKLEL